MAASAKPLVIGRRRKPKGPQAKIGLVCPYNISLGGGVQEAVKAAQAELKRRGYDVLIITPRSKEARENPPADTLLVGTGTSVRLPSGTTAQLSASINSDELEEIIDHHQFDILHFHEPWVPMVSRQLLLRSKSINVATFHACMPDDDMIRMLEKAMIRTIEKVALPFSRTMLKHFDALVAVSDPAGQYVRGLTDTPVEIIPNGIDLKKFHALRRPRSHSKRTVLFIGRLEGRKGVKHLIDAFVRLGDIDARLVIAGDGSDRKKLESYAAQWPDLDISFLGYVSEEEKIKLLREADIFSSPALYGESFGIVLLEAMATGTPVVAGNNAGYASVLQGRGLISLVDPRDSMQFARRLALFLYDRELAKLWRKWALSNVKQYDYAKVIDQYEALYTKLLKERKQ